MQELILKPQELILKSQELTLKSQELTLRFRELILKFRELILKFLTHHKSITAMNLVFCTVTLLLVVFAFWYSKVGRQRASGQKAVRLIAGRSWKFSFSEWTRTQKGLLLLVILAVALAVRAWQFGVIPGGINQDEAMAAVEAKALLLYGTDRFGMRFPVHFTAWGSAQMNVLESYLMIPFIKVFGLTVTAIRLPMLIMSMIGIVFLFLTAREIFGEGTAFIVLSFVALDPWHVMQSRWALEANMLPHFFIIGIYFLIRGIRKKGFLFLSMVFFALSMYAYAVTLYTVPVFLLFFCVFLLRKKLITWKEAVVSVLIYFLIAGPFFVTMFLNALKLPTITTPWFTMPYFPDSIRSKDVLFFADHIGLQFLENTKAFVRVVILQQFEQRWNTIPGFGTVFVFFVPVLFWGIYCLCVRLKKSTSQLERAGYAAVGIWGLVSIWAGIVTADVNVNRINIIFYCMILIIGLGIHELFQITRKGTVFLAAAYLVAACMFLTNYFCVHSTTLNEAFCSDFMEALYSVEDRECDTFYITPQTFYNSETVSEILTMFAFDIDAHYYQGLTDELEGRQVKPYQERYQYLHPSSFQVDPKEDAIYIVLNSEENLAQFPETEFHVAVFGRFSVMIPLAFYD